MPDFVKPLADVEVNEGKEVVLKCKVAGLPYPTIAWYHKGKPIESSEERKMTQRKQRSQSKNEAEAFLEEGEMVNKNVVCLFSRQGCPQSGHSECLSRSRGRLQGRDRQQSGQSCLLCTPICHR